MQPTKSRWSVVCGFSGEIYSGHRTEAMANKKADETRKGLWYPNVTGPYWDRECAIRRMCAGDPRYPKISGKYLLPLAPDLGVRPGEPQYHNIMDRYRHSCGSLAGYVQVVPAGSYFDGGRWVVPSDIEGNRYDLKPVPDFEAAARARLTYETEEAERDHDLHDVTSNNPPPEHIAAMIREIDAARDADIPLAEDDNDE